MRCSTLTEALLKEPEFLKDLHKIREELAKEERKKALKELKAIREKYRAKLGHLYIEE
jgi:predicted ribosome quality control (RQC) complex YloA/Tae2 family protein